MRVTLLPGAEAKSACEALHRLRLEGMNLRGAGPQGAYRRLIAYLEWASSAVEALSRELVSADVNRLVLTKRYEMLLASVGTLAGTATEPLVNALVSQELQERVDALGEALKTLERQRSLWQLRGHPVVADTSFYIQHPVKLEEVDFSELTGIVNDSVHLIVPMVVVDELDRLKESKDRLTRWRAGYTLAVLDRLFKDSTEHAVLREPDPDSLQRNGSRHGEVTVEILFDPPGHVRLPIADDELVDRALAVKPFTWREVRVLTYDTGQSMRARMDGLGVIKPVKDIGEEPEQESGSGKRANTRARDCTGGQERKAHG